jgi:flavin-binding protein dodecin
VLLPQTSKEELAMTMLKVIEVLAQSDKSWEDAAANAVKQAAETVRGIKSIYVKEMEASVEDGKIVQYRVNAKISFLLAES